MSNPVRGLGARKAAFCCASPTVSLAEPIPETDPSAIRSTASELVVATADRHRVPLEEKKKIASQRKNTKFFWGLERVERTQSP